MDRHSEYSLSNHGLYRPEGPPTLLSKTGTQDSLEIHLTDQENTRERWPWWSFILLAWSVVGVLFASSIYLSRTALGDPVVAWEAIGVGFIEAYAWAAVTVAAFWLTRRFHLERGRWLSSGLVHLLAGATLVLIRATAIHYIFQWTGWFPERTFLHAIYGLVPPNFVTYWMLVGIALAIEYARRYRERELSSAQLEAQLTRARLQALKMQLHPHFLFNTLHAISSLVHRDPDAAERMIANLSEMLRTALAHEAAQEVTVQEELELLEPYLEIEKTRMGDRLTITQEIAPETRNAQLPHLILQPLVENAIKHGIAPRRGAGQVEITTARLNGHLKLRVRDNGRGMPAGAELSRPGGVGLSNTRDRLKQLYGAEHRLNVSSSPEAGTLIEITIPFRPVSSGSSEYSAKYSR
ncbi:histidine kinase [soil metagenome]